MNFFDFLVLDNELHDFLKAYYEEFYDEDSKIVSIEAGMKNHPIYQLFTRVHNVTPSDPLSSENANIRVLVPLIDHALEALFEGRGYKSQRN